MPSQTTVTVANETQVNTAIQAIDATGSHAATNTAYMIDITGPISLASDLRAINLKSESTMLDAVPEPEQLSQPKPEHVRRLACHWRKAPDGALASTWTTNDEPCSDKKPASAAQMLAVDAKPLRERRAIIAGIAGNVMEWYDFSVYGYFAPNIGRAPLLPSTRLGFVPDCGVWRFRRRFPDAPFGKSAVRPYRRQNGPQGGAHGVSRADGNPDLSDRHTSELSADWSDSLGVARADAAASRTFGWRRVYDHFDISRRTFGCRASRVFRKFC